LMGLGWGSAIGVEEVWVEMSFLPNNRLKKAAMLIGRRFHGAKPQMRMA
jgi:hypothetical protein